VNYGHHLAVTIYLHVAPSSGRHTGFPSSHVDVATATIPRGKSGMKMNEMNKIYFSLFTVV